MMKTKNIGWHLDNSYTQLPSLFFTKIKPNIVSLPKLEIFNDDLGKSLGLDIEALDRKSVV